MIDIKIIFRYVASYFFVFISEKIASILFELYVHYELNLYWNNKD
jgi:hypothetical protein